MVNLPLTLTSRKNASLVLVALTTGSLIGAGAFYYLSRISPGEVSPIIQPLLPVWVLFNVALGVFLFFKLDPRTVRFSASEISLLPIPFLGMKSSVPQTRSISEFQSLEMYKENTGKSGILTRLKVHSDAGTKDLPLDLPKNVDKHQFIRDLGAALKLKVNDNA